MVNYGYNKDSPNWDKNKRFQLTKEVSKRLNIPNATNDKNYENDGHSPYIEVDDDGVRIRRLTHLSEKEQRKIEQEADKIYDEVMVEETKQKCCNACSLEKVVPAKLEYNAISTIKNSQTFDSPEGEVFTDEVFFKGLGIQENDRLKKLQLQKKLWEAKMSSIGEEDFIQKEDISMLKYYWRTSFKASLDEAKVFVVEDDVVPLLLHTECQDGNFPFPSVFIDTKVQIKDRTYFGFHIGSYYTEKTQYKAILTAYSKYVKHNGKMVKMVKILIPDYILLSKNTDEDLPFRKSDYYHNKIKNLAFSFCAFINEPDVSLVLHPLNPKNNIRRKERGVMPLPEYKNVVIRGKLRIYVDKTKQAWQGGTHTPFSYRFWVRGFYRHFFDKKKYAILYALEDEDRKKAGLTFSEKHKEVLRKWIKPFVKGQGILIKQSWEVTE